MNQINRILVVSLLLLFSFNSNAQTVSNDKKNETLVYTVSNITDNKNADDIKAALAWNFGEKIQSITIDYAKNEFTIHFGSYYNSKEILEFLRSSNHEAYFIDNNKIFRLNNDGINLEILNVEPTK